MLRLEEVTRRYGATRALDGVTLALDPGSLTALVGENGAGKTTLLRIGATLESPSAGIARVAGARGADARRQIAWLGQEPGLYDELTARENLRFAARLFGREREVADAARAFDVEAKLDLRARILSRGERQRVALARAWLGGPLMLLDEPTTALDAEGAQRAIETLIGLRGTRTMLVATHDAELVKRADRVLRLSHGRLA
jgi:ABC-type multidrug transport system ATPase subunit